VYVQGESLKTGAASLTRASKLPGSGELESMRLAICMALAALGLSTCERNEPADAVENTRIADTSANDTDDAVAAPAPPTALVGPKGDLLPAADKRPSLWVKYDANNYRPGRVEGRIYLGRSDKQPIKPLETIWMRQELNDNVIPEKLNGILIPHSFITELEFDCERHRNRPLLAVIYSRHAGEGQIVRTTAPEREWADDRGSYLDLERQACASTAAVTATAHSEESAPLPAPDPPDLAPTWRWLPPTTKIAIVAGMFELLDHLRDTGWLDRVGGAASLEKGFRISPQQADSVVEAWKQTRGHGSAGRRASEAIARWQE
jgi:hypothetical protein